MKVFLEFVTMLFLFHVVGFWPGGTWDLPHQGIEPVSPMLARGFSSTGSPGKPLSLSFRRGLFHVAIMPISSVVFLNSVSSCTRIMKTVQESGLCSSQTLPVFHYNLRDDFETYVSLCMDTVSFCTVSFCMAVRAGL